MKVLIISCDLRIATPAGAAYIAGAAREAGHDVQIFDSYLAGDLEPELRKKLIEFNPDVAGISITAVVSDTPDSESEFKTKHLDQRPKIKQIVETIKQHSEARIVLGGCGFNYFAENWLNYLDLDYGIRGESEYAFPLYLKYLEEGGDMARVPGAVTRKGNDFRKTEREWIKALDSTAYPAYDLIDTDAYRQQNIPFAIFTKRGCAFQCTFCPYSSLEGTRYRLKSPERVINEIKHIRKITHSTHINFCDNSFNAPRKHAESICHEMIQERIPVQWQSGAIKPLRITGDFCDLMKASGCTYVGLAIESASETMLEKMHRGYRVDDIKKALDNLDESGLPFGLSILLGAPGETPETIDETFRLIEPYSKIAQNVWISIGICLWTQHQKVIDIARREGQLKDDQELFDGAYYISPELPEGYMRELIETFQIKEKYNVQVNKPFASYKKRVN